MRANPDGRQYGELTDRQDDCLRSLRDAIKLIRAERSHIAMDAMHNSVLAEYLDDVVGEAMSRLVAAGDGYAQPMGQANH